MVAKISAFLAFFTYNFLSMKKDDILDQKTKSLILGIDPGFSGGICAVEIATGKIDTLVRMPIIKTTKTLLGSKSERRELDIKAITELLTILRPHAGLIVIERVSASPQMGSTSAFRFGEGFGILLGLAYGLQYQVHLPRPSVWKSTFILSSDKRDSLLLASKLFPEYTSTFKVKANDGLAEAALLAEFGRKHLKHEN